MCHFDLSNVITKIKVILKHNNWINKPCTKKKEQKLSTKSASSSSSQQLQKTIYQVANYRKPQKQYKSTTTAKNYDYDFV